MPNQLSQPRWFQNSLKTFEILNKQIIFAQKQCIFIIYFDDELGSLPHKYIYKQGIVSVTED